MQRMNFNPVARVRGNSPSKSKLVRKSTYDYLPRLDGTTIDEVLDQLDANFKAEKHKLYYNFDPDALLKMDNISDIHQAIRNMECVRQYRGIINGDTQYDMGVMSADYGIVDYREVLDFTSKLAADGAASFERGTTIDGGAQIYLVMKTNDYVDLGGGDILDCYFYITSSHNGQSKLELIPAPLRRNGGMVCVAEKMTAMKFKHTKHVGNTLQNAQRTIQGVANYWEEFKKNFKLFASTKLTQPQLDDYLKMVIPGDDVDDNGKDTRAKKTRDRIDTIFKTNPAIAGLPNTNGTLLGAYFSVVYYADQEQTVRKTKYLSESDAVIRASFDGAIAERKAKAYGMCLKINEKIISLGDNE